MDRRKKENEQTFFEELIMGNDLYREELPDGNETDNIGLSSDGVHKLSDDIMNPMPSSDEQPPQ